MLFASALAGLFLAASCQQENLEPVMSGNTVTYTMQVPENIATKAKPTGYGFTLHYEVYRQGDVTKLNADPVYEGTKTFENGSADVELEFVKDQEFTVLFWAQQTNGAQAYNIEGEARGARAPEPRRRAHACRCLADVAPPAQGFPPPS